MLVIILGLTTICFRVGKNEKARTVDEELIFWISHHQKRLANYKKDVFSNPPFTAEELFEKMEEIGREMKTLVQATEGSFYFDEGWLSSSLLESEEGCQKIKEFVEGEVSDRLREKVNQHTEISSLPELNQWAREYAVINLLGYGLISVRKKAILERGIEINPDVINSTWKKTKILLGGVKFSIRSHFVLSY